MCDWNKKILQTYYYSRYNIYFKQKCFFANGFAIGIPGGRCRHLHYGKQEDRQQTNSEVTQILPASESSKKKKPVCQVSKLNERKLESGLRKLAGRQKDNIYRERKLQELTKTKLSTSGGADAKASASNNTINTAWNRNQPLE